VLLYEITRHGTWRPGFVNPYPIPRKRMWSDFITLRILNRGTRRRQLISFWHWPVYWGGHNPITHWMTQ